MFKHKIYEVLEWFPLGLKSRNIQDLHVDAETIAFNIILCYML